MGLIKALLKHVYFMLSAAEARLRLKLNRPRRFSGVFASRALALASLPEGKRSAYDSENVADVNFEHMSQRMSWDYPVIYWINAIMGAEKENPLKVLDAGGHMGTKYISFVDLLAVDKLNWSVYDLPEILKSARLYQDKGLVPSAINFVDQPGAAGEVDLLLASGLLQYLDIPLAELLGQMAVRPRHILLNKVAVRDEETILTLEKIGPVMVPYQIRSKAAFENELADLGYRIVDQWTIPDLSHKISTHPMLPASQSKGYMLEWIG
jgi:putative methyltransferase (TIGR04325 family)